MLAQVFRHFIPDAKQFQFFDDVRDKCLADVADHLSGNQQSCQLLQQNRCASALNSVDLSTCLLMCFKCDIIILLLVIILIILQFICIALKSIVLISGALHKLSNCS